MLVFRSLWIQGRQAASVVRFKPFDLSTEEGRSKERYRRVVLATIASAGAKVVSVFTALISVPLTLSYLGMERYGLWVTMSSVVAMLAFADLGLGNGLINAISEAHGKGDAEAARAYVSSGFFMLGGIGLLLFLTFAALYPLIPWPRVFNVKSDLAIVEAGPATAMLVACFALNMPLGVVQRVQMGFQEGFANALWQALGSLLSLVALVLAIQQKAGLPWLVLAMAGAPALAAALNSLAVFTIQRPWLCPRLRAFTLASAKRVTSMGFLFFVLQIAGALAYQSDSIVVAQILGAGQVTQYAVPMKLFSLAPIALSFMLMPLWPAYGESIARKDVAWVRRTLKRSLLLSLALNVSAALFLAAFGVGIIHLWAGPEVTPSFLLLLGLSLWIVLNGIGGPLAALLNGANVIRFQAVCSSLMAVANLAISIILTYRIGVAGVIFGTVTAQLLFIFLPSAVFVPKLLSSLESRRAAETKVLSGRTWA